MSTQHNGARQKNIACTSNKLYKNFDVFTKIRVERNRMQVQKFLFLSKKGQRRGRVSSKEKQKKNSVNYHGAIQLEKIFLVFLLGKKLCALVCVVFSIIIEV